jgi:hypothetical protein
MRPNASARLESSSSSLCQKIRQSRTRMAQCPSHVAGHFGRPVSTSKGTMRSRLGLKPLATSPFCVALIAPIQPRQPQQPYDEQSDESYETPGQHVVKHRGTVCAASAILPGAGACLVAGRSVPKPSINPKVRNKRYDRLEGQSPRSEGGPCAACLQGLAHSGGVGDTNALRIADYGDAAHAIRRWFAQAREPGTRP